MLSFGIRHISKNINRGTTQKEMLMNPAIRRSVLGVLSLAATLSLAGCANVSVKALDENGKYIEGSGDGVRYYLPKPYLLVMRLPATAGSNNGNHNPGSHPPSAPTQPGGGGDEKKGEADEPNADKPDDGGGGGDPAPAGGAASSQFSAGTPQYVAKLIYLPDLSKPMAIVAKAGFGTVSLNATLQDGWMLTNLQGTSDSKVAETLTAIASVITARRSGGGGGGEEKKEQPGGAPASLLTPGLYRFDYDAAKGTVNSLCYVTLFEAPSSDGKSDALPKSCPAP